MVNIQFQDMSGNWTTAASNVQNNSLVILKRMQDVQRMYHNKRVRAVDQSGLWQILVDML